MKTGIIYSKKSLGHDTGDGHPENKFRIQSILERLKKVEANAASLVDESLNLLGPLEVSEITRTELINHVESLGSFDWSNNSGLQRTIELFQLIVATKEYQFC